MVSGILALGAFVVVTTYSPGPNNIMATASGASQGLRKSLPFLLGITAGFLLVMLVSAFFDRFLAEAIQGVEVYLKWLGFAYMVWLAISFFLPKGKKTGANPSFSPLSGLLLQLVNPKVILYGLSLWGLMPREISSSLANTLLASGALTVIGFSSVLLWCTAGSVLMGFLADRRRHMAFDILMALLLLASAIVLVIGH